MKNKVNNKIQLKKLKIRGDEVAILFFSLLFIVFLFISFFRLFAIGKLFDDFIFIFLFGWTKYLVYLTLLIIVIPVFFNCYFKIKFSFIFSLFLTLFSISWLVTNVNLMLNNDINSIWVKDDVYNFANLNDYFKTWWSSTIINNYYGFFAQPISFTNWSDINSYFPAFAVGGIVSNALVSATSSFFITNFILNIVLLFVGITWLLFSKPWIILAIIFFFLVPIVIYFRKKRIKNIHNNSENKSNQYSKINNKYLNPKSLIKHDSFDEAKQTFNKTPENFTSNRVNNRPKNQKIVIENVIESGTLTPFGKVKNHTEKVVKDSDFSTINLEQE